ncbi:alpha/beta fold hydrolase [Antarcticirhabdus aurantiaca]|uniref:Alpha/beta hydrolase n=1 Tax=Antarcticirhabdus aurantiaca TaxID=2606717 RepID=A0ACD4NIH5_9HYPH|nr:alpha/beta hydrolase [Antarcticirhabdus aurantiaca]WAJ26623.1 alpha/beta hydrolase [Jeongeuplla avenae]
MPTAAPFPDLPPDTGYSPFAFNSADGLRLAGRDYPGRADAGLTGLPLVCLPGLTRNSRDFHAFALAIRALQPHRRVVCFDYRGRGASQRAADAATYVLPVEAGDVVAGLDRLGIGRAIVVGTSRGALITHLLAASHPHLIAGAVMNDAGPKLEIEGLLAIKAYVGATPVLPDWDAALAAIDRINGADFPALTRADRQRMAWAIFRAAPDGTGILADYDPRLADGLRAISADNPLPELWPLFDALGNVPILAIRGEHSRLFSDHTLRAMAARHPDLVAVTVPGQGHAPLLETAELPKAIGRFADKVDATPPPRTDA